MSQSMSPSTEPTSNRAMARDEFEFFVQWAQESGWLSPSFCSTHDGPPLTEEEDEDFIEGFDPCIVVMRVWDNDI